jgi:hypothetical protein
VASWQSLIRVNLCPSAVVRLCFLRVNSCPFAVGFWREIFFSAVWDTIGGMKAFLAGVVIGIVLVPAALFLFIWLGYAPVSTKSAPLPFERKLAGIALDKRIEKEAPALAGR